jgi:hypothetical protein
MYEVHAVNGKTIQLTAHLVGGGVCKTRLSLSELRVAANTEDTELAQLSQDVLREAIASVRDWKRGQERMKLEPQRANTEASGFGWGELEVV